MQLFFNPDLNPASNSISFDKLESKHIIRVLRKRENDILNITDGKGNLYDAKISLANDKHCIADIIAVHKQPKTWSYYLHIAIAPTKNNDRFEWFLEKATEIGIDEITPILCQNSERKVVKLERLEKIVVSAMKQSLQCVLPQLNPPTSFSDFLNQNHSGTLCIAHCEDSKKTLLKHAVQTSNKTTILIGPEGDFSVAEITKALDKGFHPVSLGENRLRTETAGLSAVHTLAIVN